MNKLILAFAAAALIGAEARAADSYTPGEPVRGKFKNFAKPFLEEHCFDCHDEDLKKGTPLLSLLEVLSGFHLVSHRALSSSASFSKKPLSSSLDFV